jgi:hypothetical protein
MSSSSKARLLSLSERTGRGRPYAPVLLLYNPSFCSSDPWSAVIAQTIIECLKYATTGELPPNTKGGAFVHDPKMAGEKEVKAQVRLRFWNVKRERMVVNRNLQVTVKKGGGMTMKTLEGMLSKCDAGDGGERVRLRAFLLLTTGQLIKPFNSGMRSLLNAPRWMQRSLDLWAYRRLFSRMSSSVIRRSRIGPLPSLQRSKKSSTISSKRASELYRFRSFVES